VTHTVTISGVVFQPADLTISLGDSVERVNRDPFPHDATATAGTFKSKAIEPEQSFTFTPTAPGDYSYLCSRHPTMRAIVRVR
jgi:plastocyanin